MERKRRSVLFLAVLCTLLLVSTTSGGQALEAPQTAAPQLDPAGPPPDDNWDGTDPDLVPPPEPQPAVPSPENNLAPGAVVPAPQSDPAGPPPDDNWDGTAPGLGAPPESQPVPPSSRNNLAPGVLAP